MATMQQAVVLERIGLVVSDLAAACAFYEGSLGFSRIDDGAGDGAVAVLALGGQAVELSQAAPTGRPYPTDRSAADPWFQHFAIVTADMAAAYARLGPETGATPISTGGPVTLPPATGSIQAYKFRDPDGHPLELSYFPPGVASPAWANAPGGAVFLGIDHSAIAVTDVEASIAFYTQGLGMTVAVRQVNIGPTQDRLDGLSRAEVDIVTLSLGAEGPHLELLAYRGRSGPLPLHIDPDDIAATRLILRAADLASRMRQLEVAGGSPVAGVRGALFRDPDGHLLEVRQA